MSGRPLLVSLAIVAVAAIVVASWILLGPHASPPTVIAPPRSERAASSPPDAPPAPASLPSPSLTARRVASDQEETEGERTVVDGSVVVTDVEGIDHFKEGGSIVPWLCKAQSLDDDLREWIAHGPPTLCRLDPVPVKSGRFHLELPGRPEALRVTFQMTLGGRPALFDEGCSAARFFEDAKRGKATLRAHWIECVRLHVVDRESGRELDEVSIVGRRDVVRRIWEIADGARASRDSYLPGRASALETVLEHGCSPLVVHPRFVEGSVQPFDEWFVRARGHAWARIDLHFDEMVGRTVERTLELGAGATVVVDVKGELPQPRVTSSGDPLVPMLRLHQKTQTAGFPVSFLQNMVIAEEPAALGETRFESLEASAITASIEVGRDSDRSRIVQDARADLAAGGTTRIELVLAPEVALQPVPLAGTLFVPEGWKIPDGRLLIRRASGVDWDDFEGRDLPLSQMKPLPDRPRWFSWSAGTVPPAEYEFDVEAAGFAQIETITPPGNEHVELALAEPARLDVEVVDEATGQQVVLRWVAWRAIHAQSMRYGSASIELRYDAARGRYSGAVPIGEGLLSGAGGGDWTLDEDRSAATIHSGDQRLTVAAQHTSGVAVELCCGATKVPWSASLIDHCTVEPLDDPGAPTVRALRDALLVVRVTAPGRYRLTIPEIPGFAPVEPFEVNLPEGRFITRTIYLSKP